MLNLDVDFMTFGDVKLFIPKGDNLYNLYDSAMRGFSPHAYYSELTNNGYRYPISQADLRTTADPRYAPYAFIQILAEDGIAIDVLDVGAFAGLFGIRCAHVARCFGYDVAVKMFDPSIAGQVIPYNIEANQFRAPMVEHVDEAISLSGGPLLFTMMTGHLDSARIAIEGSKIPSTSENRSGRTLRMARRLPYLLFHPRALMHAISRRLWPTPAPETKSYLVRSTTFADYFAANPDRRSRHQIIKIDTEGLEPLLLEQLLSLDLPGGFSAIIETTPRAYKELGIDLAQFLVELTRNFGLFELYHFPHPTGIRPVLAADIDAFVAEITAYPHGHSDLLIVPRNLPNYERIATRMAQFKSRPPGTSLVLD